MRLRKKPWAVPTIEQSPVGIMNPQAYKGKWQSYFKKSQPLYVELGTGKGNFITTNATLYKEVNFLGIEMKPEALVSAILKAEHILHQGNLGLVLGNVNSILDYFAENEVDRLYINFCDPWPKRAHAKRRLTHERFLQMYRQFLKPNAEIHLKTDNQDLFEFSFNELAQHGFRITSLTLDLHRNAPEGNILTEYEQKFVSRGMPIYRLTAVLE